MTTLDPTAPGLATAVVGDDDDGAGLVPAVSHEMFRLVGVDEPESTIIRWSSTLTVREGRDRVVAAEATSWVASTWRNETPYTLGQLLDDISADLSVYQPLADSDDVGELLIIDRVSVAPAWRGRGLGPLLVAEIIDDLGWNSDRVACCPAPFELDPTVYLDEHGHRQVTDPAAEAAWHTRRAELVELWSRLGFDLVDDLVMVLDNSAFTTHHRSLLAHHGLLDD